jgi:Zn-dependent protease with chaperone function
MKIFPKNKKGGVVSDTVQGVGGLIIGVVIILVIVSTLMGANLLTAGSAYNTTASNMVTNFTAGLDNISAKIPTILLIVAVVFLFGALVLLVSRSRQMGIGAGGSV